MERFFEDNQEAQGLMKESLGNPEELKTAIAREELGEMCEGDEILQELLDDALDAARRYTASICAFQLGVLKGAERQAFQRFDEVRKVTHDALISKINILARTLSAAGKNGRWVEEFAGDRASYGRFAMILTYRELLDQEKELSVMEEVRS